MYSASFISRYLSATLSNVNRAALRHGLSAALCNPGMKTVEEVRRLRLLQLKQDYKTWVELGQMAGLGSRDSTLSQIANMSPGSRTGQPKTMGSDLARRLEASCGKPEGWMDTDPAFDDTTWPFGDLVDLKKVSRLSNHKLHEAARYLNFLLQDEPAAGNELAA